MSAKPGDDPGRLNSLDQAFADFLFSDQQFQHELIPVENYFPQYMDKLECSATEVMQGVHSGVQNADDGPLIRSYKANCAEDLAFQQQRQMHQQQQEPSSVSYTFTPPNPVVMNIPQNQNMASYATADASMNTQDYYPFNQGARPSHAASGILPYGAGAHGLVQQGSGSGTKELHKQQFGDSGESIDSLNAENSKQKDNKSMRQRLLNQQAQQRYRQRKKEKGAEMQKTIDDMSAKIQALLVIKKEKEALEVKAKDFEDKLVEKEAEIVQLRSELDALRRAGTVAKATADLQAAPLAQFGSAERKEEDELQQRLKELPTLDDVVSNEELVQKLIGQFQIKVDVLKNFMQERNLLIDSGIEPITNDVSIEVKTKIREMVNGTMYTCLQLMSLQSVDVWEAIRANHDRPQLHQRDHWIHFVRNMRFNQQQRAQLLQVRKQYIDNLERIFVERQSLNLQTISVLLPQQHGGNAPATVGTTGRFNLRGYFSRSKQRAKMGGLLEALKLNLKKEQVAVAKLDYWLFNRVLNPLQASWFVFECYPQHCDSLALLNAVYEASSEEAGRKEPQQQDAEDSMMSLNFQQYLPDTQPEPMFP